MHHKAFGCRVLHGPTGKLTTLPQVLTGKEGRGKEGRDGGRVREGKTHF